MKYCTKCGMRAEDYALFCISCGNAIPMPPEFERSNNNRAYMQNNHYPPDAQIGYNQYNPHPEYVQKSKQLKHLSDDPAVNTLKNAASSTLFLCFLVLLTISSVFGLLSAFYSDTFHDNLNNLFNSNSYLYTDIYLVFKDTIEICGLIIFVFSIIGFIPNVLMCAGLWKFYMSSKRYNDGSVSVSGLKMVKLFCFYYIASVSAGAVIFPVVIAFTADSSKAGNQFIIPAAVIIALIFALFFAVFSILYYVFVLKTLEAVSFTALNKEPTNKISSFVAIYNIINGASFILLFHNLNLVSFIYYLLNSAFFIILGIAMLSYKKSMTNLMLNQRQSRG